MATRQERIIEIRERADQMKARAQLLEALEQKAERKLRERKKYVAGAAVLAAVESGALALATLTELVGRHNQRKGDRALFGLDD